MRQRFCICVFLLSLTASAQGQSNPVGPTQTTRRPTAVAPAKPKPSPAPSQPKPVPKPEDPPEAEAPRPKYLTVPVDPRQTNLGVAFAGHDITAVVEAIKNSPSLKEKSEYESTAVFQARRSGFPDQPLFGDVKPTTVFAFVLEESLFAPEFKYDADAQAMGVTLSGRTMRFIMDKDRPTLDGVLIRRLSRDRDSYIGGNAFGASVKVDRTYSEEFGVAFEQANWLFGQSGGYTRTFSYLLAMEPEIAKAIKADLKLVLVCRLTEPWLRHSAHGHDPTVSEPYETIVGENYLQVDPVQLWAINSRTGDVVRRFSEASIAADQSEQLSLKLRQTPLLLEVKAASSAQLYRIRIDDAEEKRGVLENAGTTFGAKQKIVLTLDYPRNLPDVRLTLNGKEYAPNWNKDATRIGTFESIRSATVSITLP